MFKPFGLVFGAILILGGGAFALKTVYEAGTFDRVWEHPLPTCRIIKGLVGAEDLVQIPGSEKVLISATDRGRIVPASASGLYLLDLSLPDPEPVLLSGSTGLAWQPHGLGLWSDGETIRIFAINHTHPYDTIEILQLDGETLVSLKSIVVPGVQTLNAVVPLGPESFFASQDLGAQNPWLQKPERYLQWAGGSLWLYAGGQLRRAAEDLVSPNGLALSPDGRHLYVASLLKRKLLVFQHDPATHALQKQKEFFLDTAPDNLRWSPDGRLLTGAHLKLLDMAKHMESPLEHRSPSQLIAIGGLPDSLQIEEIYSSRGEVMSGVTTGLRVGRHWIMGSAYDEGVMVCEATRMDLAVSAE